MKYLLICASLLIFSNSVVPLQAEDKAESPSMEERLKKIASLPMPVDKLLALSESAEYKGKTYTITSKILFNLPRDSKKKSKIIAKYNKRKKLPLRIISYVKYAAGSRSKYNFKGKAEFYLIDKTDKFVIKKKINLKKLCPT